MMMNRPIFLFLPLAAAFLWSCGGPASYTTPLVMESRILQSECRSFEPGEPVPEEQVTIQVRGGTVEMRHENLYLPQGTLLGIKDRDGFLSWRDAAPYYYLDADIDYITLRESAQLVSNEVFCLYDLTVTIQNISGGEYTFYLFDHRGAAVSGATAELEIR